MGKLVRCTECIFFRELYIWTLTSYDTKLPLNCESCHPFDFEDERALNLRVNFHPITTKNDK